MEQATNLPKLWNRKRKDAGSQYNGTTSPKRHRESVLRLTGEDGRDGGLAPARACLEEDGDLESLDRSIVQFTVGGDDGTDVLVPIINPNLEAEDVTGTRRRSLSSSQDSSAKTSGTPEPIVLSSDDEESANIARHRSPTVHTLVTVEDVGKQGQLSQEAVIAQEDPDKQDMQLADQEIIIPLTDTTEQAEVMLTFERKALWRYSVWEEREMEMRELHFQGDEEPAPAAVLLFCVTEAAAAAVQRDLCKLCVEQGGTTNTNTGKASPFILLMLKYPLEGMEGALLRSLLEIDCLNSLTHEQSIAPVGEDRFGCWEDLDSPVLSLDESIELIRRTGLDSHLLFLLGLESTNSTGMNSGPDGSHSDRDEGNNSPGRNPLDVGLHKKTVSELEVAKELEVAPEQEKALEQETGKQVKAEEDQKEQELEHPSEMKKEEPTPAYTLCHRRTKGSYSVSLFKPDSSWTKYKHQGLACRLIQFPPPPLKGGITVTMEDLQCLDSGQFLNDVIIDFYLKFLLHNASAAVAERSHIFSSFFYKQLTRRDNASEGVSSDSCQRQRRHQRVKTWTRHVDIFKKDFLFVPVNQEAHWYLVVICFPGLHEPKCEARPGPDSQTATSHEGSDESQDQDEAQTPKSPNHNMETPPTLNPSDTVATETEKAKDESTKVAPPGPVNCTEKTFQKKVVCKRPCILIMDSLKISLHERVFKLLREYLQSEWEVRRGSSREFCTDQMKSSHCQVPLQDNSSDCGLYLLQYVESFLKVKRSATLEGSSMGHLILPYSEEPAAFPHIVRLSDVKVSHEGHAVISRKKRNILFPSGVKLCAQETAPQVVANHLSYFHLRVCQETTWEAFKIFWDRLPEQDEYQSWMSQCQEGTVTAQDIGSYFSESDEHKALVKRVVDTFANNMSFNLQRMLLQVSPPGPGSICAALQHQSHRKLLQRQSSLDNDIAAQPPTPVVLEQVVELSILLTEEMYSVDLEDPASLQFQTLSRQLAEKIEDALETLPGFKSVSVLDFRPQKDSQGPDGVVADFAVTVAVDAAGVSNDQLDYLTLQSNQVENSYRKVKEPPTVAYAISEVKSIVTEALHENEPESVSEIPESVNAADGAVVSVVDESQEVTIWVEDVEDDDLPESSETITAATSGNDVVVLEESTVVSAAPLLITSAPGTDSMEEEGLLLEDTVQTPAVENPIPEELPAELPSPELPEDFTLPEPPVEIEASGLDLQDLLQPTTAGIEEEDKEEEEEEEEEEDEGVSLAETATEDELITADVAVDAGDVSDSVSNAVEEEPTAADKVTLEDLPIEVVENEVEIREELESATITTTEEESLPALVPPPEAVDIVSEASEPESAETDLLPVDEESMEGTIEDSDLTDVPPAHEETNPEEAAISVVFENLEPSENGEESVFEDHGVEEATQSEGQEVMVDSETPEETEAPGAPSISKEDLTEDEVLLVNKDESEPPVTDSLSPVQPTALSPERESPFTRVSEANPAPEGQPDIFIPSLVEIQTSIEGLDDATIGDPGFEVIHYGYGLINHTEEGSTGFPSGVADGTDQASIAMPVNPGRALMVFFSLRVTNMIFSDDLFNKSSAEYKALEQRFLELLVPYLQSNLSNFENLEILNFRNGSIVVNSRMKFGKPVAQAVTTTVYLILEDFCNTAYQTMNLAIDKYSLDVESGDQADPCKFQACNEYAECKVNKWSGEAECVCNAGYFSVDGLPCQSICELRTDFCLNDGKCDIIPGQGAICRCRVGENWWYRGEHCEEYVSEPLVVGIAVASVAGFLLVASGVIFFLARTLRDQYDKDESEDPIRGAESLPSLERATKYNPMYESEATTGYSHYHRRYPEFPHYSSASAEASTDFSSEEIRHIYENSELTKEEIQDRIRIIELYAKDRQFADFVRQHQAVLETCREGSSAQT
ncbi:putative interphotoreceptor matrix proteoglycan 2 [Scophthalmus maximus]|uniref:Interphotoreceptor matrix proteoglycan 2 n=1 Tax=Scophthalmus maximus TaxID=52904 RepID=A0A2U9CBH7_SCOMX|nr:putative interphotoreceptor matrix proteoglycan 2 [Scophthalmus maximus]